MKKILYVLSFYCLLFTTTTYVMEKSRNNSVSDFEVIKNENQKEEQSSTKTKWTTTREYKEMINEKEQKVTQLTHKLATALQKTQELNDRYTTIQQQVDELKKANEDLILDNKEKATEIVRLTSLVNLTKGEQIKQLGEQRNNLVLEIETLKKENKTLKSDNESKTIELSRNTAVTTLVTGFQQNQLTNITTKNSLIIFLERHFPCLRQNRDFKPLDEKKK